MNLTRRNFLKLSVATITLSLLLPKNSFADSIKVPVLQYHDISDQFRDEYTISPSIFAAQMEWLYSHGYKALSVKEIDGVNGSEKVAIITFDDGYASFMDYAFPLLKEYGFKATIHIIGQHVGTFIVEGGSRPMLSWDEYRCLIKSGLVDLGCHTYNMHIWRGNIGGVIMFSEEERKKDLLLFQEIFQKEIGKDTEILAWPYGLYNKNAMEIAKKVGFKYILTSNEGYLREGYDPYEIPRLNISNKLDLISFQQYVGGGK